MPPMLDPFAVDGLADLLGAGGPDGPLVLEEAQALGFERQSAIVEQATDFGFRVLDQALVEHAVDAAGQRLVEVRHQADVIAVVAAKVREVVAETLAAGVVLLEVREAAGERVPARVDDLRVRQREPDHRHVQEVVRHLVDEVRAVGPAVDAGALQVALAELRERLRAHARQHFRVGADVLGFRLRAQLPGQGDELGQLGRPLDRRVAGEDLLEQRRARPRHADDEDRVRRRTAAARARIEELAGEDGFQLLDALRVQVGVVAVARAVQRIAFCIVLEGLRVVARVLVRLAKGEVQVHAVRLVDRGVLDAARASPRGRSR